MESGIIITPLLKRIQRLQASHPDVLDAHFVIENAERMLPIECGVEDVQLLPTNETLATHCTLGEMMYFKFGEYLRDAPQGGLMDRNLVLCTWRTNPNQPPSSQEMRSVVLCP